MRTLGDLSRFVVAADEGDAVWITDFEGEEEEKSLYAKVTAIDKVACMG